MKALGYAGGYGESILNGLLPILFVWKGRYIMKKECHFSAFFNKKVLSLLLLITFAIIVLETIYVIKGV